METIETTDNIIRAIYVGRRNNTNRISDQRWGFVTLAGAERFGKECWFKGQVGKYLKPAPKIGAIYDIPVSADGETYRFGNAEYITTANADTEFLTKIVPPSSYNHSATLFGLGEVTDKSDRALVARFEALDAIAENRGLEGARASREKINQLDEMLVPLHDILKTCRTSADRTLLISKIIDKLYFDK